MQSTDSMLRYRLILAILFPVLIVYTLIQAIKYRSLRFFLQRTGLSYGPAQSTDIWIHATSVGEVSAAIPLINAFQDKYKDPSFLVSTTTPTGARLLAQKNINNTRHFYLPLDYSFMVSRFLNNIKPKCALVMETEIWPNLYRHCDKINIPLFIINGRLSAKTLNTKTWIKSLYRETLKFPSKILTRSDNDAKSFIALGASPEKVKTIGNIKFSANLATPENKLDLPEKKFILAASTHDNEEYLLAETWKQRELEKQGYLLVIVPRHPTRLNSILQQLASLNLNTAVRSRSDAITEKTELYIADTVGELVDFMTAAQLVFVGGSLVPVGGHNILEPALLGKPIVFGPHMNNFADEAELLLNFDAAIQVEGADQTGDTIHDFFDNPDKLIEMGKRARQLMEKQKDTATRYVSELKEIFEN